MWIQALGRQPCRCRAARGDLPGAQGHSRGWAKQRVNNATRLSVLQRATRLFASPVPTPALTRATLDSRRCMRRVPSLSRFARLACWSKPSHCSVPLRSPISLLPQPYPPIWSTTFGATDAHRRHMTRPFPPPSFSRSQSWASQARSDTIADYVEDSEPEREERRLKAAKTRPVKRKKTPVVIVVPKPAEDVIELTDSSPSRPSTPEPRSVNVQPAPLVIIDVSGEFQRL